MYLILLPFLLLLPVYIIPEHCKQILNVCFKNMLHISTAPSDLSVRGTGKQSSPFLPYSVYSLFVETTKLSKMSTFIYKQ